MALEQVVKDLLEERRSLLQQITKIEKALKALDVSIPDARTPVRRTSDRKPRDGVSATVLALMKENANVELDAVKVLAILQSRGWTTTSQNARNLIASTLGGLHRSAEIEKVSKGKYVYPNPVEAFEKALETFAVVRHESSPVIPVASHG